MTSSPRGSFQRIVVVLMAALGLTGCIAPPDTAPSATSRPSPSRRPFDGRKTLYIGLDLDAHAGAKGSRPYTAFDQAVADYITRQLGPDIDYQPVVVIPSTREKVLEEKRVDLVIASYAYTPARAQHVDFAGTYLVSDNGVLVRKENADNLYSRNDLPQKDREICTVANSIQAQDTQVHSHAVGRDEVCVSEVKSGKAFAYYSGITIVSRMAAADPDLVAVRIPDLGSRAYTSVGVPQGSADCRLIAGLVKKFLRDEWQSDFQTHLKYLVRLDPNFSLDYKPTYEMVDRYTKCSAHP